MNAPEIHDAQGWISLRLLLGISAAVLLPILLWADGNGPQWWRDRGVQSHDAPANDYAAANQGQVKNIAIKAIAELDDNLSGGAGDTLHALATRLSGTTANANDYAAVNLGQLKTLAKPFFDRLLSVGYQGHPLESGTYPWVGTEGATNDYAMANIGQVKNLFSFDLGYLTPPPAAEPLEFSVPNDNAGPLAITLQASATNGKMLTYSIVTPPSQGTVSGAGQQVRYTPPLGYVGFDTFTYKANDGYHDSNVATVTINVTAPPRVSAGPNQSIFLSGTANLAGTAIPATGLTYSWSKTSGPGIITFGDPTSLQTSASFSSSGIYKLMLVASDGVASRASSVIIEVNPDASTPPCVQLTSPTLGQVFPTTTGNPAATITCNASASANVSKVEYFSGPIKVGESVTSPDFNFPWQGVRPGSYAITAKATATVTGTQTICAYSARALIKVSRPDDPDPTPADPPTVDPNSPGSAPDPNLDTDGDGHPDSEDAYPNDPNRWKDVPVLQMAGINMSDGIANGKDVDMVALDNNQAAFAVNDFTDDTIKVHTWVSGSATLKQSFTSSTAVAIQGGDDGDLLDISFHPRLLLPSGKVYGGIGGAMENKLFVGENGIVQVLDFDGNPSPIDPWNLETSTVGWEFEDATENGFCRWGGDFIAEESYHEIFYNDSSGTHRASFSEFLPSRMNRNGWAIGDSEGQYQLWNGSDLVNLTGKPLGINDQGTVVCWNSDYTHLRLLQSGTSAEVDLTDLLGDYKNQIKDLYPGSDDVFISDADPENHNAYYILFSGKSLEGDGNGTWVDRNFRVRISGTNAELSIIQAPEGVTLSEFGHWRVMKTINAKGVIAQLGKLNASATNDQALLLLPFEVSVDADNTTLENYPDLTMGDLGGAEKAAQQSDDEEKYPGVRVYTNLIDADNDGVPGYADGIEKFGNSHTGACWKFEPIIINATSLKSLPNAKFKFKYSASDPDQMTCAGTGADAVYTLPKDKVLRIWKKDGDIIRNPKSAHRDGDFINTDQEYTAEELGWHDGDEVIRLYLEVVQAKVDESFRVDITFYPLGTDHPESIGTDWFKVRPYYISTENQGPDGE